MTREWIQMKFNNKTIGYHTKFYSNLVMNAFTISYIRNRIKEISSYKEFIVKDLIKELATKGKRINFNLTKDIYIYNNYDFSWKNY